MDQLRPGVITGSPCPQGNVMFPVNSVFRRKWRRNTDAGAGDFDAVVALSAVVFSVSPS